MFVTVTFLRAKPGEEDAVVALYEDWQRHLLAGAIGFRSIELLSDPSDSGSLIAIVHYDSEEAWKLSMEDPDQSAWYERLLSLIYGDLVMMKCYRQWQAQIDDQGQTQADSVVSNPIGLPIAE